MQLERLDIQLKSWGPNEGKLEGEITFKNPTGKIQLILDDATCHKILVLCSEGLVNSAQDVARNLTTSVLAAPLLTSKSEEI